MKKLFNSRFLIILASSLVVLILLIVGAFYLFDDKDDVFVKSGYVLNPLSSTSEKYYFDENVGYRQNLSSMIEFVDVDEKTVSVLVDSFVHYLDDSISLLKNGAILDLDSVVGNKAVSFYNITNKSMIEKKDDGYVIDSANGEIKLDNFIARISENKYIVVGDLSLKMTGNSTNVEGDYFEIVYVEEGIVNIENKDVKYQVAAADTFINVGGNKVIDLGNKTIKINDEDIMSITAITIDGDENIEIIPKGNDDTDEDGNGTGGGTGQSGDGQTGTGGNAGTGDTSGSTGATGDNDVTGGDDVGGTGNAGSKEETEEVVVSLKDVAITSVNINVTFDIVNAKVNDDFVLQVVNLSSGRITQIEGSDEVSVIAEKVIPVTSLTPATKYLFRVINKKDDAKYFQKILETSGFGVKLEKVYATSNSLVYNVIVEEDTEIEDADITLQMFNESKGEYELVEGSERKLSELKNGQCPFNNLKSDTIYTVVLNNFSVKGMPGVFVDKYKMSLTSLTLKAPLDLSEVILNANGDDENDSYELFMEGIKDPDTAIVNYKYKVYEEKIDDDGVISYVEVPISNGEKTENSPVYVKVGTGNGELNVNSNYRYKVIIEYFDNEKYMDIETDFKELPNLDAKANITIEVDENTLDHDSFDAKIKLIDPGCLIYGPHRGEDEACYGTSSTYVYVRKINPFTQQPYSDDEMEPVFYEKVEFVTDSNGEFYYNLITGDILEAGETYYVEVKACIGRNTCLEYKNIYPTDDLMSKISTKSLATIKVDWGAHDSNKEHVLSVPIKFVEVPPAEGVNAMDPEDTIDLIKKVRISLYEGNITKEADFKKKDAETDPKVIEADIKDLLYDKNFVVSTLDTFGLSMVDLENLSDNNGKLSYDYTILVEAFLDDEEENSFGLTSSHMSFSVDPQLIGGEVTTTLFKKAIYYREIKNNDAFDKNIFGDFTGSESEPVVGYRIDGSFDLAAIDAFGGYKPSEIHFYVYNRYSGKKVDFYVKNEEGLPVKTEGQKYSMSVSGDTGSFSGVEIYMVRGTEYGTGAFDDIMARGNTFYIGYEIEATNGKDTMIVDTPSTANGDSDDVADGSGEKYVKHPEDKGKGVYKTVSEPKASPTLKMYVASSTENSITYKYTVLDPDKAIYKEPDNEDYGFYYKVAGGTEKKYPMVMDGDNKFAGEFVIEGLKKGDIYSYYYKKNTSKTGQLASDVSDVLTGKVPENRIFDGYYDFSSNEDIDKYNFKYQILSNLEDDNRLIIKILANDSSGTNSNILDRILSYKVDLVPVVGEPQSFKLGDDELKSLSVCPGDETDATPRCLIIDYIYIKDMKSSDYENPNKITVNVSAMYDNGRTGYDFTVGEDKDYEYMIMQTNSYSTGLGSYIGFNSNGNGLESGSALAKNGFYTYSWRANNDGSYSWTYIKMKYKDEIGEGEKNYDFRKTFTVYLDSLGYKSNDMYLNPKMVSEDDVNCKSNGSDPCNEFSFITFTPKVNVKKTSSLLDGAIVNITLSNTDLNDIQPEGVNKDEHFLYVYVWDRTSGVTPGIDDNGNFYDNPVRTVKVPIDVSSGDPNGKTFTATIDGLKEWTGVSNEGLYSYGIFAYKLTPDGDYEIEHLPDVNEDNDEALIYEFDSAKANDFFSSVDIDKVKDKTYGVRNLTTKIQLKKVGVSFDFDLIYVLCDSADERECDPTTGTKKIFDDEATLDDLLGLSGSLLYKKNNDVSGIENLEYDKTYYMFVYAEVKDCLSNGSKCDETDSDDVPHRTVLLNPSLAKAEVYLDSLSEPTFKVTREPTIKNDANGEAVYGLDFDIVAYDDDKTLVDGIFNVKLLDSEGILVDERNGLDASVTHEGVLFTGLKANSKYTLVVYGDVYRNNATIEDRESRKYVLEKNFAAYTVDDYGIAFGEEVFGMTERTAFINFRYGGRFNESIARVDYTISSADESAGVITASSDKIPDDNKFTEYWDYDEVTNNPTTNHWTFGVRLSKAITKGDYRVRFEFFFKDPNSDEEVIGYSRVIEQIVPYGQ